jgi:hypothetical protein
MKLANALIFDDDDDDSDGRDDDSRSGDEESSGDDRDDRDDLSSAADGISGHKLENAYSYGFLERYASSARCSP